jgi:hypothetical protein
LSHPPRDHYPNIKQASIALRVELNAIANVASEKGTRALDSLKKIIG